MSKHAELIERLRCFDRVTCNEAANALEALAREIEGLHAARRAYASEFPPDNEGEPDVGSIHQNIRAMKAEIEWLRKDAYRAEQLEQLARYMFEADNDYGAGFSGDPNWRLWYTRLADLVGVKLESTP